MPAITDLGLGKRQSDLGLAAKIDLAGGSWIDDDVDACHSPPVDRRPDDVAALALPGWETMVRKAAQHATPADIDFRHPGHLAIAAACAHPRDPGGHPGPALPFPGRWPAFLISDRPPPLPA